MNRTLRKYTFKTKDLILPKITGREACNLIQLSLANDHPVMIARLGAVEIKAVLYSILPPD